MPRGRGGKRGRRPAMRLSILANSFDHEDGDSQETSMDIALESSENVQPQYIKLTHGGTDANVDAAVDEDEFVDDLGDTQLEKRATTGQVEGDIDVDDDVVDSCASPDEDDDDDTGEEGEETEDALSPAEEAAHYCRLPTKETSSEELFLFPFLEHVNRALQDSYICVRNFACLMWAQDSCIQVTPMRLYQFVLENMSTENIRVMKDAGLTAPSPTTQTPGSHSSASSVSEEPVNSGIVNRGKSGKENCRLTASQLTALAVPPNWYPWSTANARYNLEQLCQLSILFLERYGYINFGIFKVLATPLTHVTLTSSSNHSGRQSTGINESGDVTIDTSSMTPPRRAAAERALAATRRSGSSGSLSASSCSATPPHFIILGAGMAGLIAARQLSYFGAKVILLESKDRVGGRIWTLQRKDVVGELGAMVVTGLGANPVSVLTRQLPVNLMEINAECSLYDCRGRLVARDVDKKVEEEFNKLLGASAYFSHVKNFDSITTETGENKLLSLGETIDLLIRYQERHKINLKVTHRKLMAKLLNRKRELLTQIAMERQSIAVAFERWQTAAAKADTCTVVMTPQVSAVHANSVEPKRELDSTDEKNKPSRGALSSPSYTSASQGAEEIKPDLVQRLSDHQDSDVTFQTCTLPRPSPSVYNVSLQFEIRRLLSQLHEAWKKFEPLQAALSRVNRQLDVLIQYQPKDAYLTDNELRVLDWHLSNLEFANATELRNLSLRHWDQDDMFELHGDHCIIREGYGALTDALASVIGSGTSTLSTTSPTSAANSSKIDSDAGFGPAHIELKSSAKLIVINGEKGVRVDALNAAISQDELISYEADAVLCTLPLGVLKESVKLQQQSTSKMSASNTRTGTQQNSSGTTTSAISIGSIQSNTHHTTLTAPLFEPPLPAWKVESINRLGFGVMNKVVLVFDKFFWDRSQNLFGHVSETAETRGELFMFWSISDRPVLTALVAGRSAMELERSKEMIGMSGSSSSQQQQRTPTGSSRQSQVIRGSPGHSINLSTSQALREPIVVKAMQILRGIFGQDGGGVMNAPQSLLERKKTIPNPTEAYVTRWASDTDSYGSYSYIGIRATGADYDVLGDPINDQSATTTAEHSTNKSGGTEHRRLSSKDAPQRKQRPLTRLFFAGEHTCRCYPATVHGALLSGLREAARMANCYFPGSTPIHRVDFKLNPQNNTPDGATSIIATV